MAAVAACKRVVRLGTDSGIIGLVQFSGVRAPKSFSSRPSYRHLSQQANGQLDTIALVGKLEGQGVPSKQAEAITEIVNICLENMSESVVSKVEMEKTEMLQESNLSKFKAEMHSSQAHNFSLLQHETEKLRNDIEKMRSELRYEIDKVTAGQRLDLNLERGRTREELANQNAETNKLDREIHALSAQLEAAKYDVIKSCIVAQASVFAVGLAVVYILM